MTAARIDLVIEQGADWSHVFNLYVPGNTAQPMDLTGYKAAMQIRSAVAAAVPLVVLTDVNGLIVFTPLQGRIACSLSAAATGAMTLGYAVYDMQITSPAGIVTRLVQGGVTLSFGVTR